MNVPNGKDSTGVFGVVWRVSVLVAFVIATFPPWFSAMRPGLDAHGNWSKRSLESTPRLRAGHCFHLRPSGIRSRCRLIRTELRSCRSFPSGSACPLVDLGRHVALPDSGDMAPLLFAVTSRDHTGLSVGRELPVDRGHDLDDGWLPSSRGPRPADDLGSTSHNCLGIGIAFQIQCRCRPVRARSWCGASSNCSATRACGCSANWACWP